MADVPVKIFKSRKTLMGVSPSIPSGVEGEPLPPVNPPGSNPNGGTRTHNDLQGIQGGIEGERYHLTESERALIGAGGFKAKGVRTQTGFFDPNISGTTPVSIFQAPFSWIASYFSVGTVIEIDLVGTFTAVSSSFLVNLRIGTDNYSEIEILSSGGNDEVFRVNYKITLSASNEIKIATNISTNGGNNFTRFETATKNMNAAFDIDVKAKFITSNAGNNVKSNLIEVKVY
jgi:hypothetical protein